ncbi:MAG: metallophosphoesterase [Gammaproteobacteria bacterium]|nr:metallophosphoesterase [Gammaproteobacteria bacterium]
MKLIHISDSHISHLNEQREKDLTACVEYINHNHADADVVVHTGDVSHDGLVQEYQLAKDRLDGLSAPYFVIPGNRDKREPMMKVFATQATTFPESAFIQYAIEEYPVRIIMLDTLSEHSNKGRLCSQRRQQLASLLDANRQKPTLICLHHAPVRVDAIPDPWQFEDWQDVEAFSALLNAHSQVRMLCCGHIHRNHEGELGDGLPVHAISCMAVDLRKGQLSEYERTRPMVNSYSL